MGVGRTDGHAQDAGLGERPLYLFRSPFLRAGPKSGTVRRFRRANLRTRSRKADRGGRPVVGERRQCAGERPRRSSGTGFRCGALPGRRELARGAGRHRRRRRHARPACKLLYGAISYQADAQPDERCQRTVPPPRPDRRTTACRGILLLHILAVGYVSGVESAPDACQ